MRVCMHVCIEALKQVCSIHGGSVACVLYLFRCMRACEQHLSARVCRRDNLFVFVCVRACVVRVCITQEHHVSVHAVVSGYDMSLESGCAIVYLNTVRRYKTCTSEIMVELSDVREGLSVRRHALEN